MVEQKPREIWQNCNKGDVYVSQVGYDGRVSSTRVLPGARIDITYDDRRMNQDIAYSREADLFTNGTLSRIQLFDGADDFAELSSNPNVMGESEIKDLFTLTATNFKKKLQEIDNVRVLERLAEFAQDTSVNASVAQVKAINARLDQVAPTRGELPSFSDMTDGNEIHPIRLS